LKIITGLGNPGKRYEKTRHNAGFIFLDRFAALHSLKFSPSKYDFYSARGSINGNPFLLVKPVTYVNLSGNAVKDVLDEYGSSPEDLLVIHDEINLMPGTFKVKQKGGDGGHNGISSIIYAIENDNFPRIRIGVGNHFRPGEMADFVLEPFTKEEEELMSGIMESCFELVNSFIASGVKGLLDANSKMVNKPKRQIINPGD